MKIIRRFILPAFALSSLIACNTGFELEEEDSNDTIYRGPSENASWRLVLDEDGESFRIQKRTSPSDEDNQYAMSGSYTTLETGFTEFSISSGRNSEVTTSDLPAIKIGDDSFVFFPFTEDSNELLALIPTDTCPGSDVRGNALFLDRASDTTSAENFWMSSFQYDVSQNQAEYSDTTALDDAFSPLGDALDQLGGDCTDGYAESDSGDHYLTTRSAIIEINDQFSDDSYTRTFTTRSRVISDILDYDSEDYVGFVHFQGQPEDSYYVSASCDNGFCSIFQEEEYDELEKDDFVFEIEIDQTQLNYQSVNGATIGQIVDEEENQGNVACTLNSNVGSSSTKLIMCNAQAPQQNDKLVTLILISAGS